MPTPLFMLGVGSDYNMLHQPNDVITSYSSHLSFPRLSKVIIRCYEIEIMAPQMHLG